MKLSKSLTALAVVALCLSLLAMHCLQLHHENESLRSQYAKLLKDYEALSLDHARLKSDYEALLSRYAGLQESYRELKLNFSKLVRDYEALSSRFSDLQADYERLSRQHFLLQDSYSKLKDRYSSLEKSYEALSNEYSSLKSAYARLEMKLNELTNQCVKLNETLTYVIRATNSYCLIKEAMPRVLNSDSIRATASAVLSAGVSKSDFWGSMQRIYSYVTSNVEYVHDVEMLVWQVSLIVKLDGKAYVSEVECYEAWNYVQAPGLTLRIGQGDCEDQAILVYAMAKYYMREVCGVDYALYLMYVEFYSGSAHMAVLLPVQGGRACIIDPAGRYLTSQYGRIASRPALEELQRYSSHWAREGGVKYVELWDVKLDGSVFVVAKGTIEEVARALS